MESVTYGQIFEKFTAQFPTIEVDDYRPAMLPCAIIVWAKDKQRYIYHYDVSFGVGFIIGFGSLEVGASV